MKEKRKIAVVTGTRGEYGLLCGLMHEVANDPDLTLQLIVTGMHLSPEFGLTYRLIEEDGFKIDSKVEMLLSSDTSVGTAKSMALGIFGFCDAFNKLTPDIIVVLGDRFETLAVVQTALVQRIPVAHIHGGELSAGAVDDAIRHSISKMSHLHFVAAESYRKRVIQLGENPKYVFNVGSPGLERIAKNKLWSRYELENNIGFKLGELNFLVSYHPATLDAEGNAKTLQNILDALEKFTDAKIIFSKANADENGRSINQKIDEYVACHPQSKAYITLGDLNYLSLLQFVDVVIGNSSSGIIEVPWFRKPTINVGHRQQNRLRAASVIDCQGTTTEEIMTAIHKALSLDFKSSFKNMSLPYTQDRTAEKIKNSIKNIDLKKLLIKQFYDLPMEYDYETS